MCSSKKCCNFERLNSAYYILILMSKLRDMKKRFLQLSMLLITIVLAQASIVANAAGIQGKYTPRTGSKATISSFMKSIRANQETGLIDPALLIAGQKAAQTSSKDGNLTWDYAGPDNFGGLTKAVIYNNDGTVLIGTMGGDIYKTTNGGVTFQKITNLSLPISCMSKNSAGDIFIGTGDGRDAHLLNGMSDLGYEAGFIGQGIYKMAAGSTTPEVLASTTPTATNGWGYVNELAITGNKIYAATAAGIMVSEDNGESWTNIQEGSFRSVKANNNGDVLAADTTDVFLSKAGSEFNKITGTEQLPNNEYPKIIAMSENDADFMYIAYYRYDGADKVYCIGNIYFSDNNGETWKIALAGSNLYNIFGSNENPDNFNGYMIVYPDNPRRLLMGATDLWEVKDVTGQGVNSYRPQQVSIDEWSVYNSIYIHKGIHAVAFNQTNSNSFFVGTDGGVFKGTYAQSEYTFTSGNRYFINDEIHCSPTRMMNVGVGGTSMFLGGCLDHGTLYIEGLENTNNVTTGNIAFPHITNNGYASSYYDNEYAGGPCAISTISPLIYFVSATGSLATPIYRTETLGVDFDPNFTGSEDFTNPVITNENAFRTPFAFYENYNDNGNPVDTLYAPIRTTKHIGETVYAYSNQAGYPIDYIITEADATHEDNFGNMVCLQGDTIRNIHDPLSTLYVCGVEGKLYMTRDALIFNRLTDWVQISTLDGIPTTVAISGDGDMAMVGTVEGNLYKVTGLANAYTPAQACVDSAACVVTFSQLTGFSGQAITAISIDPNNNSNVLVSLGNYGNTAYAYRSTNGGTSFESVQGNLPQVPAYSCLIEKSTGLLMVGTECGIYVSEDGATWNKSGDVACPVMDLKQAVQANHDDKTDILYDEMGIPTYNTYTGVNNEGMIYAATYGSGIISCSTFKEGGDLSVNETSMAGNVQISVYPNPVKDNAQINITLNENANVRYQIFDISGRMVTSSELGYFVQGEHSVTVNTENLASGSYIICLQAGNKTETGKFLVY